MAWLGLLLLVVLLISNVIYCNLFFSFLVNCNIRLVAAFPLPRVRSDIWHQLWTPFPHRPNQSSLCPFHVLFVCLFSLFALPLPLCYSPRTTYRPSYLKPISSSRFTSHLHTSHTSSLSLCFYLLSTFVPIMEQNLNPYTIIICVKGFQHFSYKILSLEMKSMK